MPTRARASEYTHLKGIVYMPSMFLDDVADSYKLFPSPSLTARWASDSESAVPRYSITTMDPSSASRTERLFVFRRSATVPATRREAVVGAHEALLCCRKDHFLRKREKNETYLQGNIKPVPSNFNISLQKIYNYGAARARGFSRTRGRRLLCERASGVQGQRGR